MKAFKATEEEVHTFSEKELHLWNKGYLAAIEGLLEQITDDKIRILNKLMSIEHLDDKQILKKMLESRLVVLDSYGDHYEKRLASLARDAE